MKGFDLDMPEAHWTSGALAARGVTVISVDYRHLGGGFHYPDEPGASVSIDRFVRWIERGFAPA